MKTTHWLLLLSLLSFCLSAVAATAVKGKVVDSEGAVIENAHVIFFADKAASTISLNMREITRETDRAGQFSINLEPGFYDMCVLSSAFTPQCRKILVLKKVAPQYNFKLRVDPLIVNKLGDKFPN